MSKTYQVAGIGNAIVDVISTVDDHFLDHMGIRKGIMQLIERERAETLFGAMRDRQEASGGSVCNTIAGVGALGLKTALVGRVRDDSLGSSRRIPNAPAPPSSTRRSRGASCRPRAR